MEKLTTTKADIDTIRCLFDAKLSDIDIAQRMGWSKSRVSKVRKANGMQRQRGNPSGLKNEYSDTADFSKLPMTPKEIAAHYRQAKFPQKNIRILAELNVTSVKTIRKILISEGVYIDSNGSKETDADIAKLRRLFREGMGDEKIACYMGWKKCRVIRVRKKYGMLRKKVAESTDIKSDGSIAAKKPITLPPNAFLDDYERAEIFLSAHEAINQYLRRRF